MNNILNEIHERVEKGIFNKSVSITMKVQNDNNWLNDWSEELIWTRLNNDIIFNITIDQIANLRNDKRYEHRNF